MPYSIGNSQLQVVKGDTNQALQAIGQAYGAVNDSYDKLARLPGMAKAMVQDDADARYTAALNKYSNDPNGLAQALANGEIDTSNVRAETLGKTQDTLSKIQNTYGLNYLQGQAEEENNWLAQNGNTYLNAKNLTDAGKDKELFALREGFKGPASIVRLLANLNPETQKNAERQLAQGSAQIALARAKYDRGVFGQKGLAQILNSIYGQGTQDPTAIGGMFDDIFAKGIITMPDGSTIDLTDALRYVSADPEAYAQLVKAANMAGFTSRNNGIVPANNAKQNTTESVALTY